MILFETKKGRKALLCLVVCLIMYSCHSSVPGNTTGGSEKPSASARDRSSRSLTVDIVAVKLDERGWGYKVNVNQKPYIFQRQIPCLAGVRPFPTRETALAVARLVKQKILQGSDPSVTMEELARVLPEDLLDQSGSGK